MILPGARRGKVQQNEVKAAGGSGDSVSQRKTSSCSGTFGHHPISAQQGKRPGTFQLRLNVYRKTGKFDIQENLQGVLSSRVSPDPLFWVWKFILGSWGTSACSFNMDVEDTASVVKATGTMPTTSWEPSPWRRTNNNTQRNHKNVSTAWNKVMNWWTALWTRNRTRTETETFRSPDGRKPAEPAEPEPGQEPEPEPKTISSWLSRTFEAFLRPGVTSWLPTNQTAPC